MRFRIIPRLWSICNVSLLRSLSPVAPQFLGRRGGGGLRFGGGGVFFDLAERGANCLAQPDRPNRFRLSCLPRRHFRNPRRGQRDAFRVARDWPRARRFVRLHRLSRRRSDRHRHRIRPPRRARKFARIRRAGDLLSRSRQFVDCRSHLRPMPLRLCLSLAPLAYEHRSRKNPRQFAHLGNRGSAKL